MQIHHSTNKIHTYTHTLFQLMESTGTKHTQTSAMNLQRTEQKRKEQNRTGADQLAHMNESDGNS